MDIETLRKANQLSGLNGKLKEVHTDIIINKNKGKKPQSIVINYEDFDKPCYININQVKNENLSRMIEAINVVIATIIKETETEFNSL